MVSKEKALSYLRLYASVWPGEGTSLYVKFNTFHERENDPNIGLAIDALGTISKIDWANRTLQIVPRLPREQ